MLTPPKIRTRVALCIGLLLLAQWLMAQQVRSFSWGSVQSLPLLKETRFITGGYTSDRLLLIRDQPISIWRKVDSVTTIPEIPVLPPGERLYKAAVHHGILFMMTLGQKIPGESRVRVHIYKSTKGAKEAKKVFTSEPYIGEYTYDDGIWPTYGYDCFLIATEQPSGFYFVLANLPAEENDHWFQDVKTFSSGDKGDKWFEKEFIAFKGPFQFHYKHTGNYGLSTYSFNDYNLISYIRRTIPFGPDSIQIPKNNVDPEHIDPLNKIESWSDVVVCKDTLYCFEYGHTANVIKVDLKNRKVLPSVTYPIDDIEWIRLNGSYYYLFSPSQGLFRAKTPLDTPEKIYPLLSTTPTLVNRVSFLSNDELLLCTFDQSILYLKIGQPLKNWDHLLPRTLPESIVPDPVSAVAKFNQLHYAIHEHKDATALASTLNGQGLNAEFFPNRKRSYLIQRYRNQFHLTEWDGKQLNVCTSHSSPLYSAFINICKEQYYHFNEINNNGYPSFGDALPNCNINYNKRIFTQFYNKILFNDHIKFFIVEEEWFNGKIKLYHYDELNLSNTLRSFPDTFEPWDWVYRKKQIFLNKKDLVTCSDITCYVTNDGALNWRKVPDPLSNVKRVFAFQDSFLFASAISDQSFYLSADWGANWVQIDNYVPAHVNAFALSGTQAYWFTRDSLYTADATGLLQLVNDIKVSNQQVPKIAELQPYPNPVLAGQEIRIPEHPGGPVKKIELYDFTGKHQNSWDATSTFVIQVPGIYWMRAKTSENHWTQSKIVVLSNTP